MYPNVEAERARKKITLEKLSEHLGITLNTLSLKLLGKSPLLFKEAVLIKECLDVDIPLEILFEEAE